MGFNQIFLFIVLSFALIGVADKLTGNRFGYGREFERGFSAMGPLALSTIGLVSISPVLAEVLRPVLIPFYSFLGADPSMFAATILACDMGGFPLAKELAQNQESGVFAGLLLGSMLGPTISFMIPVALGIIRKEDQDFMVKGVLAGVITIPLGCLAGGLVAGFDLITMLRDLIPILILSALFVAGLAKLRSKTILALKLIGKGIYGLVICSTTLTALQAMTGIVLIEGMAPIWDGIKMVTNTTIILSGTFPLLFFLNRVFKKQIDQLANLLQIGDTAALGMISLLTTSFPMFESFKDMDDHGKLMNMTFNVSGNAILGGHLAFTLAVFPQMLLPVLVGKTVASLSALWIANRIFGFKSSPVRRSPA